MFLTVFKTANTNLYKQLEKVRLVAVGLYTKKYKFPLFNCTFVVV